MWNRQGTSLWAAWRKLQLVDSLRTIQTGKKQQTHPGPELCLANDFAHSGLASGHAAPQQQADGLAVGVQLALVPPAP